MRILYSACHEVLEFDELRMLSDEGHTVFSLGHHFSPNFAGDLRPRVEAASNAMLFDEFHRTGCDLQTKKLTKEFIRHFDIVILMHDPILLINNREAFGDIPVVVRTIGQSSVSIEYAYRSLGERISIVRYSQCELALAGFAKTDAVIYFGKYASDYMPWSGDGEGLSFHNSYLARNHSTVPDVHLWQKFAKATSSELRGVGSEDVTLGFGKAPYVEMKSLFSRAPWYFYVYTYPPSYTLNLMEAMLAGVPIIAPSIDLVDRLYTTTPYHNIILWSARRYEVEALVGGGGIFYDTVDEAIQGTKRLAEDKDYARACSMAVRENALRHFDATRISRQWTKFLGSLV